MGIKILNKIFFYSYNLLIQIKDVLHERNV